MAGNHKKSELWVRDNSLDENKMPPLSRNIKDEIYLEFLAEWIDGLSLEKEDINRFYCFPNPVKGLLNLRLPNNWSTPLEIELRNMQGYLMHQQQSDDLFLQLDLIDLQSGVYIIKATDGAETINQKIIVW